MPDLTVSSDIDAFLQAANAAAGLAALGGAPISLNTTAPNDTVNAHVVAPASGSTNADLVLTPKGTGAFILGGVPDGTTTGGNKRGARAVDFNRTFAVADRVASGDDAFLGPGGGQASGNFSVAFSGSYATGYAAFAAGQGSFATGQAAASFGQLTTASGEGSFAGGISGVASRRGESAIGCTLSYVAQRTALCATRVTTDATPTELFLDGSSARVSIPAGRLCSYRVRVIGIQSDGTSVAQYLREVTIKNVAGTTSLVGSVQTIGTDHEDDAGTAITITADDTNDALAITVTGIAAETWRWLAVIEGGELAYGT